MKSNKNKILFAGNGGHCKEVKSIFLRKNEGEFLYFVTNIKYAQNNSSQICETEDIQKALALNPFFVLATGGSKLRYKFYNKLTSLGGIATTVVSETSIINTKKSNLGCGLNVMEFVYIGPQSSVGTGSLLNTSCSIHHDAKVGEFVEIAPGARILGNAKIGDQCFIGTNSVIFPNVSIGENSTIGAGLVVKHDIAPNSIIKS